MNINYKIISVTALPEIVELVYKLNKGKQSKSVLETRFKAMFAYSNYECAGVFNNNTLIGVSGLWYSMRHYVGKSVEVDHVYIESDFQGQGLGKLFFKWIYKYAKQNGCKACELNTYVSNGKSHKFYFNEGFEILGFHFLKTNL